jgi:PAS domain S-box-containing protein
MFELITPLSYWVLAVLWLVILGLYLVKLRHLKATDGAIAVLLTILALDAFRTLFESAYFGLYFNAQFGLLPARIEAALGRPEFLIIPKLINIAAGALVLFLLIRRWLPREIRNREDRIRRLESSEELYRDFVEGSDDIVTRTDSQGRFTFVNFKAQEVFGLPPAECIGLQALGFVHRGDHQKLANAFAAWKREKPRHATHENRQVSRSGEIRHMLWTVSPHFDESGELTHISNVGRDISERKRAEEERQLLATAVEQAAESIVITDVVGKIEYVNPAFEKHSGYSNKDAVGENLQILRSGHHEQAFYDEIWDKVMNGGVWHGRQINRRKDGSIFEEEATISPVEDASGNIVNYVAVKRDVTREAELEARLIQTQKMEAIGTLAGGIAHDFNNLLQVMLGYLDLARASTPEGNETLEYMEQISTAGKRAAHLVDQILAFSHKSKQESKPLHLQLILEEVLPLLRSSIPTTIEIQQFIDADTGPVLADATEVHQVAMNLCTNAYHAMREHGGVLEVTLQEVVLDAASASHLAGMKAGRTARLSVRDTGTGMDAATLERIFDPYFTTKEVGEGTGLGLAIVRGIVESCGGAISVDSELGVGTRLDLYFPLIDPVITSEGEHEDDEAMIAAGSERLLVVDDEPMVAELTRLGLTNLGYEVEVHTNCGEALEAFRMAPDSFDVVITDQTMPNMTGLELTHELLRIRPGTAIILCTGYSELVDETRAKAAGIRFFAEKPVLPRALAIAVRKIMDEDAAGQSPTRGGS